MHFTCIYYALEMQLNTACNAIGLCGTRWALCRQAGDGVNWQRVSSSLAGSSASTVAVRLSFVAVLILVSLATLAGVEAHILPGQ